MKRHTFIRSIIPLLLALGVVAGGCRKTFLAQKPSTDLLVPNSLNVLQELLDNTSVMNISPALGEVSADNYYLLYTTWLQLDTKEYNAYIWAPDIYEGQGLVSDWDIPYQQVFYANTVLQGLAGIQADSTDQAEWNMLEGWALFSRAFAFYNITQLFAKSYDSATAATDPGIGCCRSTIIGFGKKLRDIIESKSPAEKRPTLQHIPFRLIRRIRLDTR